MLWRLGITISVLAALCTASDASEPIQPELAPAPQIVHLKQTSRQAILERERRRRQERAWTKTKRVAAEPNTSAKIYPLADPMPLTRRAHARFPGWNNPYNDVATSPQNGGPLTQGIFETMDCLRICNDWKMENFPCSGVVHNPNNGDCYIKGRESEAKLFNPETVATTYLAGTCAHWELNPNMPRAMKDVCQDVTASSATFLPIRLSYTGAMQDFNAPYYGSYKITMVGGNGGGVRSFDGSYQGASGAKLFTNYNLMRGETTRVLVAGRGSDLYEPVGGGGGGGTFVYGTDWFLIGVAGGGGGTGLDDGTPGSTTRQAREGGVGADYVADRRGQAGDVNNGGGGQGGMSSGNVGAGGGGSGWNSAGTNGIPTDRGGEGGRTPGQGARGGNGVSDPNAPVGAGRGGFGGGGGAGKNGHFTILGGGGGGGGGWAGGGGGGQIRANAAGGGGGGSSYTWDGIIGAMDQDFNQVKDGYVEFLFSL